MMNIRKIIHEAIGLDTYTNFCKQAGISKYNFSAWINFRQNLSVATLFKLLNYLEVLPPERNFLSISNLTVAQLENLYHHRDDLNAIFEALKELEKKNSLVSARKKRSL